VGWIGTGVMGKHQALHLMNNGYQLYVYNRTQAKAQELLDKGA
jgi:3-hydroxyisobutyrate dehydrogenase